MVYIHNGISFFNIKSEIMLLSGKWMELEIISLSK
jgi:hypothetical protein